MNALKAVIFDLDGTLVTFKIDYMHAREEVDMYLADNGVPDSLLGKNAIITTLNKAIDFLRKNGADDDQIQKVKAGVYSIISK